MNNFIFENATKSYFGEGCVREYLGCLSGHYGKNVMLAYGGGSIAVLHPVYYRHIYCHGLRKFCRFATNVWNIRSEEKTEEELALAGIEALADFIKEIGLPTTLRELGVDETVDLKIIADSCNLSDGSYKKMTHEEILEIFKECY